MLDRIYDTVDGLMRTGRLVELDSEVNGVDVRGSSTDVLLAYLTATLPVRSSLPSRGQFFARVQEELRRRGEDDPEILRGLA